MKEQRKSSSRVTAVGWTVVKRRNDEQLTRQNDATVLVVSVNFLEAEIVRQMTI